METTAKIALTVGGAIVGSIIGLALKGVFGAFMGFILTLSAVWIFKVWRNYSVE